MKEMFSEYKQNNNTRKATLKLCKPRKNTNKGQKGLSYLGPSLWNKMDSECKLITNLNTFKHSLKSIYFNQLVKIEEDIYEYKF